MTARRTYAWGAAIGLGGALLGATAALWIGRPESLGRSLLIALTAYVAGGALVLRWGLDVYGPRGALAALGLHAFTPALLAALAAPRLQAPAGAAALAGGVAQLAAAYALTRCLLDPTVQWVLLAGLAIAATPIAAFLHGEPLAAFAAMASFSVLLVGWRILSADRWEARARVARAGAASVALAWLLAAPAVLATMVASHLPSMAEYSRADGAPADARAARPLRANGPRFQGMIRIAATEVSDPGAPGTASAGLAALPLAALLLGLVRPWRRVRRYADGACLLALLCIGVPLWLAWGEPGGVFATPFAALLAGACWDGSRPRRARRAATLLVLVQVLAALALWPRWPGGVRSDAWLPLPDELRLEERG